MGEVDSALDEATRKELIGWIYSLQIVPNTHSWTLLLGVVIVVVVVVVVGVVIVVVVGEWGCWFFC